jgi:hypothetical protein
MIQWEYNVATFSTWTGKLKTEHIAEISRLGEDGWELAGMTALSNILTLVFKRPVPGTGRPERKGWPSW